MNSEESLRKEVNEILPKISEVREQAVQAFSNREFPQGRILSTAIITNAEALREVFEELEELA